MMSKCGSVIDIAQSENTNTTTIQDSAVAERADAEQQELTLFTESGFVSAAGAADAMNVPMHYRDTSVVENVGEYLKRPQQLSSGVWSTSSNQLLYKTSLVGGPLWVTHAHYPKVLGAFGIRARTCFRLEVTSTPQHAGHLRLVFMPFGAVDDLTRTHYSQLAGVDMFLNESTAVEFAVPYVHEKDFFRVNATDETLGTLALTSMSPLSANASANSVSWTLYWWMEDVQLIGAMPAVVGSTYLAARASVLGKLQAS